MLTDLRIPRFQDGEFLTETDLYPLSRLTLRLFGLAARSLGHVGFAHVGDVHDQRWNEFRRERDRLVVERLFVISRDGVPFVCARPHVFELSAISVDSTVLHASLYVAERSTAFQDAYFAALASDTSAYDLGEIHDDNAYRLVLHWGETAPDVEGAERFTIALGRVTDDGFETTPPASVPAALPELQAVVNRLGREIDGLTALLLDATQAAGLDRSLLLERLERLRIVLDDQHAPTRSIVAEGRLVATAAHGFYLRAAYVTERRDPRFHSCEGLSGRLLEHRLEAIGGVGRGLLEEAIRGFAALAADQPDTGHAQVTWFNRLDTLLGPDRNAQLLEGVRASDRSHEPRPEHPTRPPQRPRVIRVDESG